MTAPVSRGVFQCSSVPAPAFTKNQVQKPKNFYPLRLDAAASGMRNARVPGSERCHQARPPGQRQPGACVRNWRNWA